MAVCPSIISCSASRHKRPGALLKLGISRDESRSLLDSFVTHMSQMGPGCVKTCTIKECAELFSLFSSFDDDCQSGSFLIQCNRDKLSTRKFDVGVFTQPGSKAEKLKASKCFLLFPQQRTSSPL